MSTVSTTICRVCDTEVPEGAFCGFCGAHLEARPGDGPDWLRVRSYGPAHGEQLLRLSLVSSLFPHLAHRSRAAFRVGLSLLVVLLVAFSLLRWQAPLVAVCSLGFALLYLIYQYETDVFSDDEMPLKSMLVTAVLGVALGVGWTLWTGPGAADAYLTLSLTTKSILLHGLLLPVCGALLMLVPAVLVRLIRPRQLESLDGFLIGSLGAVAFTAAATLTRLAPQLTSGEVASPRFEGALLIEAGIQGIATPIIAAATGGMVGAALWWTARAPLRRKTFVAIAAAIAIVVVVYAARGLIEIVRIQPLMQLFVELVLAALAVAAVRIAIHLALLREIHEVMSRDPIQCAECHHVVPEMAFCPNCGTAMRATSRSSRERRRVAPAEEPTPADKHTTHVRLVVALSVALVVVIAIAVLVSWLATPTVAPVDCRHPGCGQPPTTPAPGPIRPVTPPDLPVAAPAPPPISFAPDFVVPVQQFPRFQAPDKSWSVGYPPELDLPESDKANAVSWEQVDTHSQVVLFGITARDRSASDIVRQLIEKSCPGAQLAYEIPNAMVGYQHGYGEYRDCTPHSSSASYKRGRVLAVVAIKHGIALGALAIGPYAKFDPPHPDGHPSGANLVAAADLGPYINSFMWRGDPAR